MAKRKFEQGDRVRMVRSVDGYQASGLGTVTEYEDYGQVVVEFDRKEWDGMGGRSLRSWSMASRNLVLVAKIKKGCRVEMTVASGGKRWKGPGTIVTRKKGIYGPGKWGVRFDDPKDGMVTLDGFLTSSQGWWVGGGNLKVLGNELSGLKRIEKLSVPSLDEYMDLLKGNGKFKRPYIRKTGNGEHGVQEGPDRNGSASVPRTIRKS